MKRLPSLTWSREKRYSQIIMHYWNILILGHVVIFYIENNIEKKHLFQHRNLIVYGQNN